MRSLYREKMHICGNYAEVDIYPVFFEGKKKARRKNYKETSNVQNALNEKNSKRRLIWLVNSNFCSDDLRFDVTYRTDELPTSDEEALKKLRNFLRRLKRAYKKAGLELKYIAVTEKSSKGRYHHHIIIFGGLSLRELAETWGHGYTQAKPLQFSETGVEGLARYLLKNTIGHQRYIASRNLKKPKEITRTGMISAKKIETLASIGIDGREEWKQIYKGFEVSAVEPFYNEVNGGNYITVKLYNQNAFKKKKRGNL